jgi:hypothetical protein
LEEVAMNDEIRTALEAIRRRRADLEVETQKARDAEVALERLIGEKSGSSADRVFGLSLSESIRQALRAKGPASSSEIIEWVQTDFDPDANANSIRSLLSVWSSKGRNVVRENDKYRLKEPEKPDPVTK